MEVVSHLPQEHKLWFNPPQVKSGGKNTACGKTYMYSLYHPTEMFLAAFIMQTMNISQKVNTRCVGKESASKPKK